MRAKEIAMLRWSMVTDAEGWLAVDDVIVRAGIAERIDLTGGNRG